VRRGGPREPVWALRAARAVQQEVVLPHCPLCERPCCLLDRVVVEFTWEQVRALWNVRGPRRAFDRALRQGRGPPELREQEGLYYAHTQPCPAFRQGRCAVYGTPLKPMGCTEFPVYPDRGGLRVDLRCEAVDLEAVEARIRSVVGPCPEIRRVEDPRFPFLVLLLVDG